MDLLNEIIQHKQKEVKDKKDLFPTKRLEQSVYFSSPCVSLKKYLLHKDKSGIIAEFKRKSPSKGTINPYAPVERTSIGYMQAGASALSVLTDEKFFGGKNEDLSEARKYNYCPILRKDFIIDEYQVIEAKSIGADAVLLLANVLSETQIRKFTERAHALGMEVLLELHEKEELEKAEAGIDIFGINNRNLRTFQVHLDHSLQLKEQLPAGAISVAESGIHTTDDLLLLKRAGFNGFLIGEQFMRSARPETACASFIRELNQKLMNEFEYTHENKSH